MGKRELVIAVAFAVLGLVAYFFTAPPPGETTPGARSAIERLRREVTGDRARITHATTGDVAVAEHIAELDLSTFADVTIVGSDRESVAWSLTVEASASDEATARAAAEAATLSADDRGTSLALAVDRSNDGARLESRLSLVVPSRLRVAIDGTRSGRIEKVRALAIEGAEGTLVVTDVPDGVTGGYRNGRLTITRSGGARLTLVGGAASLVDSSGRTTVSCRNASCEFHTPRGPIEVDGTNSTIRVQRPSAPIRVSATGGEVTIDSPTAAITIETRRSPVVLRLDRPVATTIVSSDASITMNLAAALPIDIDARAEHGRIDATRLGLEPAIANDVAVLRHQFGSSARVTLRSARAPIVITRQY